MARFDVLRLADGGMVIDCQADDLSGIGTRFVVPLVPPGEAPPTNARLNPTFVINGETLVMVTQFATALRVTELGRKVVSLEDDAYRVIGAIAVLIGTV